MSGNCELGRGLRTREKNATERGAGRFEKTAPDARDAPHEAHESLISRKTVEEGPLTGLSFLSTFVGQTTGDHKHFTGYFLATRLDPLIAADSFGLYGLWAAASATGSGFAGGASLESDPFLIILNYGITSSADYDEGVARLAATAVPEPSTLALLAAAGGAAMWRWRRRHGRRVSVS